MASEGPSHSPAPYAPVFTLFIDSNIDTHIAMSVPPADTVADVKRKIMIEHMLCFPDVGQLSIQALKVKRKGAFYHLSDTMPVRCAFNGNKGTWFLHADVIAKSSPKHQGGNTEQVVNDNNKQFRGDFQLQLKLSEHLNEDRPLSKNDFYIDDNMNSHENQCKLADHTCYSVPKPMSCQIESLIDMANDQLAAANQNADGSIRSCHLERQEIDKDAQLHALEPIEQEAELPTFSSPDMFADQVKGKKLEKLAESKVLENTTSTDVLKKEKSTKRSDVEDLHLDSDGASLSLPEEFSGNLHDGNSSLMEHLTNDKRKRKKKSRSFRSKPAEVGSAVPLDNHVGDFFDSTKEQNNEKKPALEKSDVIGFIPDVMKNNNEHSADEDSVPVDSSKKRKLLLDFDNERLPKISELKHLSSMDSMAVETHTIPVNVTSSYPEELSHKLTDADSSLIEHLTDDKRKKKKRRQSSKSQTDFPIPTDNHIKIFPSIGTEQITEDKATLETIETIGFVPEVKVGNNEGTTVDSHKDMINKLVDTTEKASENVVSLRVENSSREIAITDFTSESMVKGEHSNQISSTDDKRKKKKRRQSSKSQTDFPIPTDNHIKIFPSIGTEQITEDKATLETIETIGFIPEVKVGNNEGTTVDNHKDMINKLVDTTEKASENVVSLRVENSSREIAITDFTSESMVKGEHSNQISSMAGKMVESDAEKVAFASSHNNVISEYNVAPVVKEEGPFSNTAKIGPQVPKSSCRKKRPRKSLSKNVSDINEPAEFAKKEKEAPSQDDTAKLLLENPSTDDDGKLHSMRTRKSKKRNSKILSKDVSDISEVAELAINRKEAPNQYDTAKLQSEDPSAGDGGKSHSKRTRKSEKVDFKKLDKDIPNINEPAGFSNNQKEALSQDDTAKLQSENPSADNDGKSCHRRTRHSEKSDSKNLSKDVSDSNEPAELANNQKEAPDRYDTAKLQSENPSAGDDGKSHSRRTRKSGKIDSKKLSKDVPDINEPAGFANNQKEALGQDDTAKLQSENPFADNDGKLCRRRTRQSEKSDSKNLSKDVSDINEPAELANNQKEAPDQYDTAKLQSENPSAGDDRKSHNRTKKSEKVDSKKLSKDVPDINESAGFANNRKEALGQDDTAKLQSENPSADNDGKPWRRRTRQSEKVDSMNFKSDNSKAVHFSENLVKSYHKDKSNQDQQTLTDSALPTKSDDKKSHRKKKKSSNVVLQDNEPPPKDSSNSRVEKDVGETATGRLCKEPNSLATDDEAATSRSSAKGHDHGKSRALSNTLENITDQLPKSIASQGTEESVEAHKCEKFPGVDNDEINFIVVFRPNSIQDEPGVSVDQILPAETKPKKQPKSKRKNKSNKHESVHDFAYPSESEKLDMKKSSTNCDVVNQDSVDPSGKPSSELCQNGKEHNDSFNLATDSTRDDGTISSDFMSHIESVKQTIEANRLDTYHQISESQFQNGNHAHYSNEKTFLKGVTESHVQVEKEENFNLGVLAVQNQSKPSAGTFDEETHAGLAASSDSTEENIPVQATRYRLAVRKVPKSIGKKSNNHESNASFLIPSAIFNDAMDESSEDDVIFRNNEATSATSDSSSTDSEGSRTPRHHGKHEGSDGEDIILSQSSNISTKNMPLDAILKSSSSYKRAKRLASQSQADDSESQPADIVLETQPESD